MRWAVVLGVVLSLLGASPALGRKPYAQVGRSEITIGNGLIERTWTRAPFRTKALVDLRGEDRLWSTGRDFALGELGSDSLSVAAADVEPIRGGLRLTMRLTGVPGLEVRRIAEVRRGIAGLRMRTEVLAAAPLPLPSVVLEEAAVGEVVPTIHALRAGADWREPGWAGPGLQVGDPHGGTWRDTRTAARGRPLAGPAQWLTAADGDRSLVMLREGTDFPSARAAYDGSRAQLRNDYGRDVVILGPLEESAHVENPVDSPARVRVARPGELLRLEPVWIGLGRGAGDAEWQWAKHLRRVARYRSDVIFNSDRIDADRGGAKDDMDHAHVLEVAPIARALGVETFVLDDGWQQVSGDWVPDPARYRDPEFQAVREAIAPMRLGLWMSPGHFHPDSQTFLAHPEWSCQPVATGLYLYNRNDPESGSNEAGIVPWGPAAVPYMEERIRLAVETWGARYFKFDFLAWLDCAGQGDFHDFRDAFVAMLDRLRGDYRDVTFSIDETNDYRLFPYASTSRSPTWFQNGNPPVHRLLHNLWNLSPYVPARALGQAVPVGDTAQPWSTRMAAALLSHVTFFSDIRTLTPSDVAEARRWLDAYVRERPLFTRGVVYPLLEDPLHRRWTALQAWDPEKRRGALLAFRQEDPLASIRIALRNVPDGSYEVRRAPEGELVGELSGRQLREGMAVSLMPRGAAVLLIRPAVHARHRE